MYKTIPQRMDQKPRDGTDVNIVVVEWSQVLCSLHVVSVFLAFLCDNCDFGSEVVKVRRFAIEI
jgi:hypothetical protein